MPEMDIHRYPCPDCGDEVLTSAELPTGWPVPRCELCKLKAAHAKADSEIPGFENVRMHRGNTEADLLEEFENDIANALNKAAGKGVKLSRIIGMLEYVKLQAFIQNQG